MTNITLKQDTDSIAFHKLLTLHKILRNDKINLKCPICGEYKKLLARGVRTTIKRAGRYRCRSCALRGAEKTKRLNAALKANWTTHLVGSNDSVADLKMHDLITVKCGGCSEHIKMQVWSLKLVLKKHDKFICSRCANPNSFSKGEEQLLAYISELLPEHEVISGNRDILSRRRELDVWVPNVMGGLGVEYNGNWCHSEGLRSDTKRHWSKREDMEKLGHRLVQIRDDEWLYKQDIVKSMFKHLLNKSPNIFHARKLKIEDVPNKDAQVFLGRCHLMGGCSSAKSVGLYTNAGVLVQLFSYRLLSSKSTIECVRICSLLGSSVVGGVSRLMNHVVRGIPSATNLMSFVDLRYATGNSLLSQGFRRVGITLSWSWTDGRSVYNRLRCRANMDSRKLTQAQHAEELGWVKLYDAGQAKFVKTLARSIQVQAGSYGSAPKVPLKGSAKDIPNRPTTKPKKPRATKVIPSKGRAVDTGQKFGGWTVISELPKKNGVRRFNCKCSCGSEHGVWATGLFSGKSKGCRECSSTARYDITPGQDFGRWRVQKEVASESKHRKALCRCSCGVESEVFVTSLRSGKSKRCTECAGVVKQPIIKGKKFGSWEVLSEIDSVHDNRLISCRCDCGFLGKVYLANLISGTSTQCMSCLKGQDASKEEIALREWVESICGKVYSNNWELLGNQELDIVVPNFKICLEYNGLYWHSEKKKEKEYHLSKREAVVEKGYRLIQIQSDEWLYKNDIVKSLLSHTFGLTSEKYYARKLEVSYITPSKAGMFLRENHLMGDIKSVRSIGLTTSEGELVQLFSYKLLKKGTMVDCSRICTKQNVSVVGGVSKLLHWVLRDNSGIKKVMSFVDLRYADGHSLIDLGFKKVGITLGWRWTDGKQTYNRLKCRANMDLRKLTQAQHAEELGWYKIYDAGQAKFVKEL